MSGARGAELANLLLGGFTAMVDEVIGELERRGHPGVTATHEFALRAIGEGAHGATALGRSLGVSKQAAAKSIAALEELGYVAREVDPGDARRKTLVVTARGTEMMTIGAAAFDRIRTRWARQVGPARLRELETVLATLVAADPPDRSG